jgi:hypothetical protein
LFGWAGFCCCAADEDEGPKPPGGGAAAAAAGGGGGDAEDVKGPHTNLAVRLSKRDPNKKWLLGERLSYVLLTGACSHRGCVALEAACWLGVWPAWEVVVCAAGRGLRQWLDGVAANDAGASCLCMHVAKWVLP